LREDRPHPNDMKGECSFCKTISPLYFRTRDRNRRMSDHMFDYYRCPSCGLIFLSPIPSNLGDYYTAAYHSNPPTREHLLSMAAADHYKIELVQRFVSGGRLLEIGPSWGSFTYLAKAAGFQVEALEMDAGCCTYLNEVVGVKSVNESDVCTALPKLDRYDVIALWHVIEHIPDPWAALQAIAGALLPGGIVIMAAPNPSALQFRILGRFWAHVDAPRHVELIPASLLARHMASLGLEPVLDTTTDAGSLVWNAFGWEVSLSNFFAHPLTKKVARRTGNVISRLLDPFEKKNGLGSAYTVAFRKP
jgi:2-polyprenyl-3-methyl-5-hydroxy-6-metoxy-1,4-benzoquinol methylase